MKDIIVEGNEMTDFESQVLAQLSVLKMQMEQLLGNGQPGRLHELEARVDSHERGLQWLKGVGAAVGGLLTLAHLVLAWHIAKS
jgi:hypothetical protein